MRNSHFGGQGFDGQGCPAAPGQLVEMLITLEQHGIFGSNNAYLFILMLSSHWYALHRASLRPVEVV